MKLTDHIDLHRAHLIINSQDDIFSLVGTDANNKSAVKEFLSAHNGVHVTHDESIKTIIEKSKLHGLTIGYHGYMNNDKKWTISGGYPMSYEKTIDLLDVINNGLVGCV